MTRHLTFSAASDGTRIHIDADEVTALYVGTIAQPKNFGYAGLAEAAAKEPPTVIEGKHWRFEVSDPIEDVADAVWPPVDS